MNTFQEHYVEESPIKHNMPLPIIIKNKEYFIHGGSCHYPSIDNADLYISLDVEQPVYSWEQPWNQPQDKKHIRFPIEDMFIPSNSTQFQQCVEYISQELKEGKKIHVGCIGGHGRTGMFLTALVHINMQTQLQQDNISAIQYVRKFYAPKAVETIPQLIFLNKLYGIAIPEENMTKFKLFTNVFSQETGISFNEMFSPKISIDELVPTLKDIEYIIYSETLLDRRSVSKLSFANKPKSKM